MNICQSCSIPLKEEYKGTNNDGSKSEEYCKYCFENGKFIDDRTFEEEVEHLIPMYIDDRDISVEEAREAIIDALKDLKRWK